MNISLDFFICHIYLFSEFFVVCCLIFLLCYRFITLRLLFLAFGFLAFLYFREKVAIIWDPQRQKQTYENQLKEEKKIQEEWERKVAQEIAEFEGPYAHRPYIPGYDDRPDLSEKEKAVENLGWRGPGSDSRWSLDPLRKDKIFWH